MVLAEAFMQRNDLKKQIAVLQKQAASNLWQEKAAPKDFEKGTAIHPSKALEKALVLMIELKNLNISIAKANEKNSPTLRELETVSAQIAMFENILSNAESYPGDVVRESGYGISTPNLIENEWIVDIPQITTACESLKRKKRELEKTLQHSNLTTQV